jgi:hypothetical protein
MKKFLLMSGLADLENCSGRLCVNLSLSFMVVVGLI